MANNTLLPEHQSLPKCDIFSVGVASAMLSVSVKTLQRWDRAGILPAYRRNTNRRYYTRDQLTEFVKNGGLDKKAANLTQEDGDE